MISFPTVQERVSGLGTDISGSFLDVEKLADLRNKLWLGLQVACEREAPFLQSVGKLSLGNLKVRDPNPSPVRSSIKP